MRAVIATAKAQGRAGGADTIAGRAVRRTFTTVRLILPHHLFPTTDLKPSR